MAGGQHPEPVRFLVFSASLRRGSLNTRLADLAAAAIESGGGTVDVAAMRDFDAPSYDQDVQRDEGFPPGAEEFRRRLEACQAFVVASPEYNASMPGTLKNAIDCVSRYQPQPFNERHGLLMSASPSMAGGNRGPWALRVPFEHLGARLYPDMFSLARAHLAFTTEGRITSERLTLAVHPQGVSRPARAGVPGDVRELCAGDRAVFELSRDPATPGAVGRRLRGGHVPKFRGAIFDVDGVLVDSPHQKAWRESLRELMESDWRGIRDRTTWSPDAFRPHVYQEYVSGKPRMSGARAALDYFHVPDVEQHAAEYAQRKQEMVVRLIEAGDFTAYPDALRFVIAVKDAGLLIADASSSKNAGLFLRKIRLDTFAQEQGISSPSLRPGLSLLDYFDADVSGRDFAHGKPDPEIFLTAAHELGVEPRYAMVLEDASAGVEAAKAGGMAGDRDRPSRRCRTAGSGRRRHRGYHARRRRHRRPRRRAAGHADVGAR